MVLSDLKRILKQRLQSLNQCFYCGGTATAQVCTLCLNQVIRFNGTDVPACPLNTRPEIRSALPKLAPYDITAIGPHIGLLQRSITAFKYGNNPALAIPLAHLLVQEIHHQYSDKPLPQAIVPVPMHPFKQARRGYNQTLLLSDALQSSLYVPVKRNQLLINTLELPQVSKNAQQRRKKRINKTVLNPATTTQTLTHIALLDDVITTGSTMLQLIRQLEACNPALTIDLWSLTISLPHR